MLVVLRAYREAVREEGSAGSFLLGFFPLKGHGAGKGTAGGRMEAKGPGVILSGHGDRCRHHPHSFSVTLAFSVLIISVTPFRSFLFLITWLSADPLKWFETDQLCCWPKNEMFLQRSQACKFDLLPRCRGHLRCCEKPFSAVSLC